MELFKANAIRELTDRHEALEKEIHDWYIEHVYPEVAKCTSMKELGEVWGQISMACTGNDGTMRDLPGLLNVRRAFSYDALRQNVE